MKKKSLWGFWIVVSFIVFAGVTFTMVYISMNTNVDLVTDNYYEKELKYQQHIDMVKSTNSLSDQIALNFTPTTLVVSFPKIAERTKYSGTMNFFRPSDKSKDFSKDIRIDSSYSQTIGTDRMAKGMWRIKISWNVGNNQYYNEQPVIIQ
ncbi:MAG: FixH family protein [Bacteroidota bacterium]|nr:FixH family protein [Bacteroidota bacterium]